MAAMISMILLRQSVDLPLSGIERELRARHPELEVVEEGPEQTASFRLRGADLVVGNMPTPIPWADLEAAAGTSIFWPGAADEARRHETHLVARVVATGTALDQARALSQATAAILAACGDTAIGVYWAGAGVLVPTPVFIEIVEKVMPLELPLDLWIDFRVGRQAGSASGGYTTGMAAFGQMELEATASPEDPSELRQRLRALAGYLLRHGPVIEDGHTIGVDASERIRVVHAESAFGLPGKVMRLDYQTPPGQAPGTASPLPPAEGRVKPWWRFW